HPRAGELEPGEARDLAAAATYMVLGVTLDMMTAGHNGKVDSPLLDGPTDLHSLLDRLLRMTILAADERDPGGRPGVGQNGDKPRGRAASTSRSRSGARARR